MKLSILLTTEGHARDVIAILGIEPAGLPVQQVGGHSSLASAGRTGPCAGCAHKGAVWAWRDMKMDVSYSWGFGRPGIG